MEPLTNEEYADVIRCPNCHSEESIHWEERNGDQQPAYCTNCNATWIELSAVVGYIQLKVHED